MQALPCEGTRLLPGPPLSWHMVSACHATSQQHCTASTLLPCCSGRVLEDGQTLASVGIADGHSLHLVEQDPAHQPAAAAGGGAAAPGWGGGQPDMLSALMGAGGPLPPAGAIEVRCCCCLWAGWHRLLHTCLQPFRVCCALSCYPK